MKAKINLQFCIITFLLVYGCGDEKTSYEEDDKRPDENRIVQMKNEAELQVEWDNLESKVDENPELWEHVKRVFNRDLQANLPSSKEVAVRQLYRILKDPNSTASAASEALKFFVSADVKEVVRESLLNPRNDVTGWGLVITASTALVAESSKGVRDTASLPYLIHVLAKNNYPQPGSEAATIHRRMKRELIEAIKQITNFDIKSSEINVDDPEEVERVLSLARAWAKQRNIKLFEK